MSVIHTQSVDYTDYQVYGWLKALHCLVFSGDLFETDNEWCVRLKNVLIGEPVCVCVCVCVYVRTYVCHQFLHNG